MWWVMEVMGVGVGNSRPCPWAMVHYLLSIGGGKSE